ncbi:hypothetical protein BU14_0053s0011 [Porphyra umbilicalis]|uniref:RING-type domain-containing protein n=1 Tax=Porphyra umbilicalis TaxID=2786 RepID=A0A1X6PHY7_PORUM|nr:hypothetical protein BU14_0053s0011 [Porphyra umbilicalis]|eukprot:OSX80346.1 hypothetical protein BU14_0053s0011 [Porphyra umbilicalis]
MRVPSDVVYGAFGVTLLVAIVVLVRLMTVLRRQFLAGFLGDRGQPAADAQRASFDSVDSALVLDVLERSAATAITSVSSPPRVSLPEEEAAEAAKRPPLPVSRAELDRLCPPIALPQAKGGEEGTPACAVCLEAMADGHIVRQMPACAHLFHDAPSRRSTKSLLWPHLLSTNSGGSSRRGRWSTKPRTADCMMARHRQLYRA